MPRSWVKVLGHKRKDIAKRSVRPLPKALCTRFWHRKETERCNVLWSSACSVTDYKCEVKEQTTGLTGCIATVQTTHVLSKKRWKNAVHRGLSSSVDLFFNAKAFGEAQQLGQGLSEVFNSALLVTPFALPNAMKWHCANHSIKPMSADVYYLLDPVAPISVNFDRRLLLRRSHT